MLRFALVATAVALASGAKISTRDKRMTVGLDAGKTFSVTCADGRSPVCEGDGVMVQNAKCVPKEAGFSDVDAQAMIAKALAAQLATFQAKFDELEEEVNAQHDKSFDEVKVTSDKTVKPLADRLSAMDKTVADAADAIAAFQTDNGAKVDAEGKRILTSFAGVLSPDFAAKNIECTKQNTPGFDAKNKKCHVVIRTGVSCLEIWNNNKKAGTDVFLQDGIYTIKPASKEVKVFCDFHGKFGNGSPGWTMVAKISRWSRWHMKSGTAGTLTVDGPNQYRPWKISNDDINAIRKANEGKPGAKKMGFKFYCSMAAYRNRDTTGLAYDGYQYFNRECNFNANKNVNVGCDRTHCHDNAFDEDDTETLQGYADGNDCGLGGHANYRAYASYGWHYCSSNGKRVDTQAERQNPSSSTGCGHNNGWRRHTHQAGDGHLWIR